MDPDSDVGSVASDENSVISVIERPSISGDRSQESYDPNREYDTLMEQLQIDGSISSLPIQFGDLFQLILENIDCFCQVLSYSRGLTSIYLGDCDCHDWPKLQITEENEAAFTKFCQAIGSIDTIESLYLGGHNLSGNVMARLVEALPRVPEIKLFLPWNTISGEDMRTFVEAVSNHQCQTITLFLDGRLPRPVDLDDYFSDDLGEYLSGEPKNHLENEGIISHLICLHAVKSLWIDEVEFTLDECQAFGDILSSNSCRAEDLSFGGDLSDCSFPDGGGQLIGNALKSNTLLQVIYLKTLFQGSDALLASLPLNRSVKCVSIGTLPEDEKFDVAEFIKNVARRNETIKNMTFHGNNCQLDKQRLCELYSVLERNYTLQRVQVGAEEPFETILKLNAAGRSYLKEDAASKSKCIEVLGNVKDELSCLFFRLRENPVLFCDGGSRRVDVKGTKRKADQAFE